jgi:hypothetical protein
MKRACRHPEPQEPEARKTTNAGTTTFQKALQAPRISTASCGDKVLNITASAMSTDAHHINPLA